jgi:hypothetical protein
MGEKIADIGKLTLGNTKYDVELNSGLSLFDKKNQIHIQSDKFRLELSEESFKKIALAVLSANEIVKVIKNEN